MNYYKPIEWSYGARRTRSRRALPGLGLVLTLAAGMATSAPAAHAAEPGSEATAEARRSQAKQLFDAGVAAFAEHRYGDAVTAFLQADAVEPSPPLSFNIARAFEHLDKPTDALRFYRDYLRREPAAKNAAQVRARVDELAGVLAQRGVQQLTVLSTPGGASVTVDQRVVGTTPLTMELAPGVHHVQLERSGYLPAETDIELPARTPRDLVLPLEPQPAAAAPVHGAAPAANDAASRVDRRQGASAFRSAPWLVLGAGGASLLGALGFEIARRSAESAARHSTQRDFPQHLDDMESRQTAARVLAAVGGALAATGGLWLLFRMPSGPSTQVGMACDPLACRFVTAGSFR